MLWLAFLAVTVYFFYVRLVKPLSYWKRKNVKQGSPVPLFGDSLPTMLRTKAFADLQLEWYRRFPNERYTGVYQGLAPLLILRDVDLIKQIAIVDFEHFTDHKSFIPEGLDPLWSNNLFALTGQRWRDMRSTLSPAFTSNKIRNMFMLTDEVASTFVNYYLNHPEKAQLLEMKDAFSRYANDVIATCAFGLKCDSLEDSENEFYRMGKAATSSSGYRRLFKLFAIALFPKLSKLLANGFYSKEVSKFFTTIITDTIKQREERNITRPDMLQLLIAARKGALKHEEGVDSKDTGFATAEESQMGKSVKAKITDLSDTDITAQALIFFFAGFETVSTLMSFTAYELAVNVDVQKRLVEEVDETLRKCNGKVTYDELNGMKYLDMVISESLRKYPPTLNTSRVCVKPYTIKSTRPDEADVHLNVGDNVLLPMFGIHQDPKHYPDPDRYNPERFNDDNKKNINPYAYLPFGMGPRNCVGSRFALMEIKILFVKMLSNFEICAVKETQIPLKFSKKQSFIAAEHGIWVKLKKRVD